MQILAKRFLEPVIGISELLADRSRENAGARDWVLKGKWKGKPRILLLRLAPTKSRIGKRFILETKDLQAKHLAGTSLVCSTVGYVPSGLLTATLNNVITVMLNEDSGKVRFERHRAIFAKFLSIDSWALRICKKGRKRPGMDFDSENGLPEFEGVPITNWFRTESIKVLQKCQRVGLIEVEYLLGSPQLFTHAQGRLTGERLDARLFCKVRFGYQTRIRDLDSGSIPIRADAGRESMDEKAWKWIRDDIGLVPENRHLSLVFLAPAFRNPVPQRTGFGKKIKSRLIRGAK